MDKFLFFIKIWIIPFIEILIITVVLYSIYKILVRTRAIQILKGIAVIAVLFALATLFQMEIILAILNSGIQLFAITIVIIFSQEIRRIFSKLGTNNIFKRLFAEKNLEIIEIVTETVKELSEMKTGALIVFEKSIGLKNYIETTGVTIDSLIKKELLLTIFFKNTFLHDGAVICRGDRVVAASVVLPSSTKSDINKLFGLRHRAGIGVTEESDAVAIMVSEENGKISLAYEGKITYNLTISRFKEKFTELLYGEIENENTKSWDVFIRKSRDFIKEKSLTIKSKLKKYIIGNKNLIEDNKSSYTNISSKVEKISDEKVNINKNKVTQK